MLCIYVSTTQCSAPRLTLDSNLCVVNFSSPHAFDFENGQSLAACSPERCKAMSMGSADVIAPKTLPTGKVFEAVSKSFTLTDELVGELKELQNDVTVDIILVPFPLLQALQEQGLPRDKVATVFVVDRVSKKISTRRFCV